MYIWLTVLMVLASTTPILAPQSFEVASEDRWPQRALMQKLIISPESFEPDSLRKLFLEVLTADAKTYPVIKLEVFTDRKVASGNWNCKCATDITYTYWRTLYEDFRKRVPASAQLTSINGNALMRIRDQAGSVHTAVIAGEDPTVLRIGRTTFEMADLILYTSPATASQNSQLAADFFYTTQGSFDEPAVMALLQDRIGAAAIQASTVFVEPWHLFVENDHFPVIYPYEQTGELPSEQEYNLIAKTTCSNEFGTPTAGPTATNPGTRTESCPRRAGRAATAAALTALIQMRHHERAARQAALAGRPERRA